MKIHLLRADIESLKVDAIATPDLDGERTGTRTAVVSGGNLLARFVIHVHVPKASEPDADARLREATTAAIERAEGLAVAAVGLPLLGRPEEGFAIDRVARAMLEAAVAHQGRARSLQVVIFCLFGSAEHEAFTRILEELQH